MVALPLPMRLRLADAARASARCGLWAAKASLLRPALLLRPAPLLRPALRSAGSLTLDCRAAASNASRCSSTYPRAAESLSFAHSRVYERTLHGWARTTRSDSATLRQCSFTLADCAGLVLRLGDAPPRAAARASARRDRWAVAATAAAASSSACSARRRSSRRALRPGETPCRCPPPWPYTFRVRGWLSRSKTLLAGGGRALRVGLPACSFHAGEAAIPPRLTSDCQQLSQMAI
jgi:hypothetical protein